MTVDELKQAASIIKHETVEKNNTAIRIGTFLENLIDHFDTTVPKTTLDFIVDTVKKSTSGIRKNMSVIWTGDFSGIPDGFALSDGHNGVPINGVVVPDFRSKFIVGYDPRKVNDTVENYGQIGNIGGESKTILTTDQLPAFSLKIMTSQTGDNTNAPDNKNGTLEWSSAKKNGNQDYDGKVKTAEADCGKTSSIGKGLSIENRPPYYVVYFITKVSDDVNGSGVYVDYSAGYGIIINKTDPAKPIISVDTDKVATKINGKIPLSEIPTNESTGGTPTLNEEFGGGRIHHIFQPGETGYIAGKKMVQVVANEDASTDVRWSFPSLYENPFYYQQNVGTTSTAIGESKNNTDELLSLLDKNLNPAATTQYAIKLARLYAGGGFTDWNLPSKADLELLSTQHRPGGSLEGFLGVTGTHGYWSSSEDGSNSFYVRLDANAGGSGDRSGLMAVRCVRIAEYGSSDGVLLKSEASETYSKKIDLDAKANKSDEITVDPYDAGHTKPADVHLAHGAGIANVSFIAYSDANDDTIHSTYMKINDYVGESAPKYVNKAETAEAAKNAAFASATTADMLGRVIHETYATIDQVGNLVGSVYRAKGSVPNVASLPVTPANGDTYNTADTGMNYAYIGESIDATHPYDASKWDSLGGVTALATLTENGLLSSEGFAILSGLPNNYASKVNGVVPLDQMPVNVVTSGTPTLGESFGGGKIFHVLVSGETGYEEGKTKVLIAADEDASAAVRWSFPSLFDSTFEIYRQQSIGTTLDAIGEGKNNTSELLTLLDANANPAQTTQYAIKLARLYAGGGFNDWSLPSLNEGVLMRTSGVITGFTNSYYWTSTEANNGTNNSKFFNPVTGSTGSGDRSAAFPIRAIRMAEYSTTDGVVKKSELKNLTAEYIRSITTVVRISGTGLPGSTDTYRMSFSDGTHVDYNVVNGSNGTNGTNGKGIVSLAKLGTGAAGTVDTYTMTFSDNSTYVFTVTNGANGSEGSSTEIGEYVLSGLDANITLGQKVSETIRMRQQISANNIYAEVTTGPQMTGIIIDIQKNGTSIFTDKPQILYGLNLDNPPVLVAEPTIFEVGDIRTISVDQIGIRETGKNLLLSLIITKL